MKPTGALVVNQNVPATSTAALPTSWSVAAPFRPTKTALSAVPPVPPLPTGRVPVTSAVRLTAPKVGAPAALPCRTVVVVPRLASVAGAAPAPPPSTRALAVRALLEARLAALAKYGTPPLVPAAVRVSVPLVVTGLPLIVKIAGAASATLVTVPVAVLSSVVPLYLSPAPIVTAPRAVPLL